ncbi:hypothetical protein B0H34DRAFT_856077 [Crassisporium funariophilum]|nr:hypothetical protein B0H34DRAFT_856077 [Crassisporium funariophilum]
MRASPCDVFPPLPKRNMPITIFDLDPLSFTVSVLGLLGAVAATLNFLCQFKPKTLYLNFAELVAHSRNSWDDCEREGLLPVRSKRYLLLSKLEIHEERVRQLMFVTYPTWNIFTLVRAWFKSWNLVTWCSQIHEFRVGLLTISEQQRRIKTARKRAAMAGVVADVSRLEEIASSTTDSFIRSLGGGTNACASDDLEAGTPDADTNRHPSRSNSSISVADSACSSESDSTLCPSESNEYAIPVNICTRCKVSEYNPVAPDSALQDYLLEAKLGETSVIDPLATFKGKVMGSWETSHPYQPPPRPPRQTRLSVSAKFLKDRMRLTRSDRRNAQGKLPF